MERQYYNVKLKQGLSEKWVKISAKSYANASYEAESQHRGWKVIDVQEGWITIFIKPPKYTPALPVMQRPVKP